MEVDWIIATALFIIFVTWAFSYFTTLFALSSRPLKDISDTINKKIIDFLSVEVHNVPVRYVSQTNEPIKVLFFDYEWPWTLGKNSTKMFSEDRTELDCIIKNNTIFFQTSLAAGENFFIMKYKNEETPFFCNATFFVENESMASPFSVEERMLISQKKIDEMENMTYEEFKEMLGIERDFRVEIEKESENITMGPKLPPVTDIFVRETINKVDDTEEKIKIRVIVW